MKPKQKLFATMDKASGTSHLSSRDNLEVMDLGFFILPIALLAFGLWCSLLAFIVEYFHYHGTNNLAAPISQSKKLNKIWEFIGCCKSLISDPVQCKSVLLNIKNFPSQLVNWISTWLTVRFQIQLGFYWKSGTSLMSISWGTLEENEISRPQICLFWFPWWMTPVHFTEDNPAWK